jgi:large subunit ribosomal protein L9
MKVLLTQNVYNLGQIGEIVEVRPGYARNYLVPQGIALEPSEGNIRAVEAAKEEYLKRLAEEKREMQAKADLLASREITLTARANEEGHLYGSIGPAQIVAALAEDGIFIEPSQVVLDEPIRMLDKYDVTVRFDEEIQTVIHVWVVPHHDGIEGGHAGPPTDDQKQAMQAIRSTAAGEGEEEPEPVAAEEAQQAQAPSPAEAEATETEQ